MKIVKLADDYNESHYGPFANDFEVENWVNKALKDRKGFVEAGFVYIYIGDRANRIGEVVTLSMDLEPLIIRDGH